MLDGQLVNDADGVFDPADSDAPAKENSVPAGDKQPSSDDTANLVQSLVDTVQGMAEKNDALSRKIGSLSDRVEKLSKPTALPKDDKPQTPTEGLKARLDALEAREAAADKNQIFQELSLNLSDTTVPKKFAKLLQVEFGERLSVQNGEAVVLDGDQTIPVSEFLPAYLKSEGSWMLPQKKAGSQSLDGDAPAPRGNVKKISSLAEYNALSPEELKSGEFEFIG